jgi:hypothetical protein
MENSDVRNDTSACISVHVLILIRGLGLWCLMPLSAIFQLYHESVLLVEETGVPEENH